MGSVDVERQQANVLRMKALGAEVIPVTSGSNTLKDAMNEALRDWVTNVTDTFYCIGTVAGPHPYPMMVRDFQSVIGEETRAQMQAAEGRLPDSLIACIGGGSNAMGLFHPFLDDPSVEIYGVEAAGHGLTGLHAASIAGGRPGVLHGNRTYLLMDEDGQIEEGPFDLGRPSTILASGPSMPGSTTSSGCNISPPLTTRRWRHSGSARGWKASSRRSSPPMRSPACSTSLPPSPRSPDGGERVGARRQGSVQRRRLPETASLMSTRIEERFAAIAAQRRAALVAFVTAGDPDYATSLAILRALPAAGADAIELGMPFTDPMADGPAIQASSLRALEAGHNMKRTLALVGEFRAADTATPVVLMATTIRSTSTGSSAFSSTPRRPAWTVSSWSICRPRRTTSCACRRSKPGSTSSVSPPRPPMTSACRSCSRIPRASLLRLDRRHHRDGGP